MTNLPTDGLAALRAAFEIVRQPVFIVDARAHRIVDANPAGRAALGAAHDDLLDRSWIRAAALLSGITLRNVGADGRLFVAVADEPATDREVRGAISRDTLTGLANREALQRSIAGRHDVNSPHTGLALLFIDLDGFKQVNDTWGHIAGDQVLRVVAQRLIDRVRPNDLVVRYGGDEFLVVAEGLRRRRDLERLARRIAHGVRLPILIDEHEIVLSASIGIAQRKSRLTSFETLIAEADRAMYRTKALCRSGQPTGHAVSSVALTSGRRLPM